MSDLFASGHILDGILILVVLEGVGLVLVHRVTGRGPAPGDVIPTLVSGLMLMLALRAAIAELRWEFIALPLTLALAAHVADLATRWRRSR
jgi:hypothetical protein